MHEAALLRAAQPVPVVVLGMLLRPLSIGHVLALQGAGILSDSTRGLTAEQLTQAVLTCCQSWSDSSTIAFDRLLRFKLWIWRKRVQAAAKRHAARKLAGHELYGYFESEGHKFVSYLAAGSVQFEISDIQRTDRTSTPREPGCPFALRLQQWLMLMFRLSEPEAWDYSFSLAKMRWAAHWEMEGGLDIKNGADESFDDYVKREEAKAEMQLASARN